MTCATSSTKTTPFAPHLRIRANANGPVTKAIAVIRAADPDQASRRGVVAALLALFGLSTAGGAAAIAGGQSEPPAPREGHGAIVLNGSPVFFDAGRYPAEGEPILVVFGDGRIEVATMPGAYNDPYRAMNPGFMMVQVDGPEHNGVRLRREQAALIGAVRL